VRALPYILYLFVIGLFDIVVGDIISVFGVTVNAAALTLLLVTLYKPEAVALWYGLAAGIVIGAQTPSDLGWYALGLAAVGLAGFQVRQRLNLDSFYSRLLFVLGGSVIVDLVLLSIRGLDSLANQILTFVLPTAVYTTVAAWIFLLFKDGIITYKKLKSIF
jgi:rod shape-determining protein MreD